jgi:hypothetical protein
MLLLLSPRGRLVDSTARDSIFALTAFAENFATLLAFAFAFATFGSTHFGDLPLPPLAARISATFAFMRRR